MPDIQVLLGDLTGADESAAELAALSLAGAADAALPGLRSMLESSETDHRWWAVRTLAAMSDPPKEWIRQALSDRAADVRSAAALAYVAHADPQAVAPLIAMLGDEDSVTASIATSALIAQGKPAVPGLLAAFDEAGPKARIQILRALAEMRETTAIPLLMRAMEEGSAAMQYWARQGLDVLGLDMIYMTPD